ncbi:MAG: hypothetical protein MUO77_17630 [Anaerolineales bacterium]|nr:hypothetical protein [Anaerolineales bacterium]
MNINNSLRQFAKDGFIGLIVTFLGFVALLGILLSFDDVFSAGLFWSYIGRLFLFPKTSLSIANGIENWHVFNSPMPLVMLISFLVSGSSGRFFENITSRWSWGKPIIIVVIYSWLIGIIAWPILLVVIVRLWIGSTDYILSSAEAPLFFGGIGAIAGLLIGYLAGLFFNPSRGLFRIMIGAVASMCVAYSIGVGILLEQWLH